MSTGLDPHGATPGHRDINESDEPQVHKAGEGFKGFFTLSSAVKFASVNTDAGNTGDTNTLRGGNLVATETASSNEYIYDPDANDGRQTAWGVLPAHLNMLEFGTAVAKPLVPVLSHGVVKRNELIGLDAQAESQLAMRGIYMDDAPQGAAALVHPVRVSLKTADYTVLAADNGTLFVSTNTGDQEFTLPAIAAGLSFEFLQTVNQEMLITSPEGDNIILFNNATADAISYTTAGEQIGARCRVLAIYTAASTLRWIVEHLSTSTLTVIDA